MGRKRIHKSVKRYHDDVALKGTLSDSIKSSQRGIITVEECCLVEAFPWNLRVPVLLYWLTFEPDANGQRDNVDNEHYHCTESKCPKQGLPS
jgi:hypothetical protein